VQVDQALAIIAETLGIEGLFCILSAYCTHMHTLLLMPMTHAPETGARNRHQKTGVGFWRRFFTPIAKFLAPETNMDK